MKLRRPVRSLIVASIFLFSLAILLTSAEIIYAAIIPLIFLAFPIVPFRVSIAEKVVANEVKVGDKLSVALKVKIWGFGFFKLSHELPDVFELISGVNAKAKFIVGSGTVEFSYICVPRRKGIYDLGKLKIEVEGIFASFRRFAELSFDCTVDVKAKVHRIRRVELRRGVARKPTPEIDIAYIGAPGTDFREIRKYIAGDPVKFINWKVTAKLGELMVNEFEREGRKAVWLFVDANSYMVHGRIGRNCFDTAVELASSLCYYFTARGHKVGMYIVGHGILIYPESGRRQFRKVFETLMYIDPAEKIESFDSAVEVAKKYIEVYKPASIFITRVEYADLMRAVLKAKRVKLPVAVIAVVGERYEDLSSHVISLMRNRAISRLKRAGVDVYEVEAGKIVELLTRVVG